MTLVPVIVAVPVAVRTMPAASMTATVVVPDVQVTSAVKSWVVVSEKVPVAVNCSEVPSAIDGGGFFGVTASDVSIASVTVSVVVPFTVPSVAVMTDVPGSWQ